MAASFFDEFTKGVGLGLSLRQASDRAKVIEMQQQKQQFEMDQLNQENTARQKLSDYANTASGQTPGEMNLELTGEAQANQQVDPGIRPDNTGIAPDSPDFKPDITGVQGVYEAPTGGEKPTLRQIMEQGVRLGVDPRRLKAIEGAIVATDKGQPPQFGTDPNFGAYAIDGNGRVIPAPGQRQDRPMNIGPGGAVFDPKTGEVLFQNQANRRPPADIVNRTYAQVLEDTGDAKAAEDAAAAVRKRLSAASATGSETAKNEVRATPQAAAAATNIEVAKTAGRPLEAGTQKDISALESITRQVETINSNLDPKFLGPVKGTDTAFEVRRRVGTYINSPVGDSETVFRQSLADAADMLLRARSGAQINETEYKRLRELLPRATDEITPFKAGLKRFSTELQKTIETKVKLGTTPRSQLGSDSLPPPPAGWR